MLVHSLPAMSVCLLVCLATIADIRAVEDPEYQWELVTMTAPWAARDGAGLLSFWDIDRWDIGR